MMRPSHIVLLAASLDASLSWYAAVFDVLGFHKGQGNVWTASNGLSIEIRRAAEGTRPAHRFGPGLNHLGFTAASPEALYKLREKVAGAGFTVPEPQVLGDHVVVFFQDPDGMRFELTARVLSG